MKCTTTAIAIFSLVAVVLPPFLVHNAFAATSFGTDYRELVEDSPGNTPNTTTTITISSTGTYRVDPFTSGSTVTGTPSTTALGGYGWRTPEFVGRNVPGQTWSFTVTTQASIVPASGVGKVKVYAYSTNTLGTDVSFIGTATGTTNVFSSLSAQTETITFSGSATNMNQRILAVEYWIDVTTAPTSETIVTFQAASSTQLVDYPPGGSTFYYLGTASLFAFGESETATLSDTASRSIILSRSLAVSAVPTDTTVSRTVIASRDVAETSAAQMSDSISRYAEVGRSASEGSGAAINDETSRLTISTRTASETTDAIVSDVPARSVILTRPVAELDATISDTTARVQGFFRSFSDAGIISDEVSRAAVLARQSTEASGLVISDGISRLAAVTRQSADSAIISDVTSRMLAFSRKVADDGSVISETVSKMTYFVRESAEDSGALVTDSVSRATVMTRELAEVSEAVINDGAARIAIMIRESTETSGSLISDFISSILDAFEPEDKDRPRNNNVGTGGGGGGRSIIVQDETFFETNPLQKIVLPSVSILDSKGSQFSQAQTGEVVQISTVIENRQKDAQEYVVIVQIVDENNMAQAILLSPGVIESGQRSTATLDWTPDAAGRYSLAIFVCDKLDVSHSTFLLSQKVNKNVVVS